MKIPKDKKISKFVRIFIFILLTLLALFISLYIWGSIYIPRIENEDSYQGSSKYEFKQNPITRYVTLKRDEDVVYKFFFRPRIFAAWVDKDEKYLFIVTSDTGTLKGAQGLYIYDGKRTKKVYQSSNVEFANGVKNGGALYTTTFNLGSYRTVDDFYKNFNKELDLRIERMHKMMEITPDGRYLLGYESGYEGGDGFVIDLTSLEEVDLNLDVVGNLHWSPDNTCAINYGHVYGDEQYIQLVYYDEGKLQVKDYDKHFFASEFTGLYWSKSCDGYISVKSEYTLGGDYVGEGTRFYSFSVKSKDLRLVSQSVVRNLEKSIFIDSGLINVFVTLKKPKY